MSDIYGTNLGFLVGAIPTIAMIISSAALARINVGPQIEACFQNLAGGLILAAVAAELFPLMLDANPNDSMIGITVGFAIGLGMIYGVEFIVSKLEAIDQKNDDNKLDVPLTSKTYPVGFDPVNNIEDGSEMMLMKNKSKDWDEEPIERASAAMAMAEHKSHISEHLVELLTAVKFIDEKSDALLESKLTVVETEAIAEQIDAEVHSLQYKLDHCRRLLQGSESEAARDLTNTENASLTTSNWVTEDRKLLMKKRVIGMKRTVEHLIDHIHEPKIDKPVLKEIYEHMDEFESLLQGFHQSFENAASKWHRRAAMFDLTKVGDTLPFGLILPVTLDCFVDGFLIGVSVGVNPKAGYVLAAANCLEMSFLGMAYSATLSKCTGSSTLVRNIALYSPPLIMFLASGLGAVLAFSSQSIPPIYIGFVAFGVVALLSLVCNELLIEARNAQGDDERWWISIMIFVGIYIVLMLSHTI